MEANTFTPINTQEEFDAAISARLQRERNKYADYADIKSANEKLQADLDAERQKHESTAATIAELNQRIKDHETAAVKMRIADEFHIPADARDRLRGETEEEIRADAEKFAPLFKQKTTAPLRSTEPETVDTKMAAYKELLKNL